mmetsp:Transcript_14686/g.22644  ORF Transcript_14686/g.22644 Transcript_14686/m.22644 type:complete len:83 (-) Transcript_14686:295-543(-)
MVDEGGEVAEGPGWCDWLHNEWESHTCKIPDKLRWPKHDIFANSDEQSCCCNNGIVDTYPYDHDAPKDQGRHSSRPTVVKWC